MRRLAVLLSLALSCAGCGEEPRTREFSFFAFGTLVELTVAESDEATAQRARELAVERLERWHRDWHAWEPGPLESLNAALADEREAPAPADIRELIRRARALSAASGGRFNPAIGRLVGTWGFHSDEAPSGPPPDDETIESLVARDPTMDDLVLERETVRSHNSAVQLDFGAFAKGTALTWLSDAIRDMGIQNFLLNAGGDMVAQGSRGDRPWRIGVRDPRGTGVLASLEPGDGEAVFTSGDYERYFIWQGRRYHHIIDPRTGRPARGVRSVTVLHEDAGLADAAATALFVAGPDDWPAVAREMGIDFVMLVDAEGAIHLTPAMRDRVRIEAEPRPPVQVQTR